MSYRSLLLFTPIMARVPVIREVADLVMDWPSSELELDE